MRHLMTGLGLLGALFAAGSAMAAPAAGSPEAVVTDFDQMVMDHHAEAAIEKYIAPDFVEHDPVVSDGKAGLIKYMKAHGWTPGGNQQMKDIIDHTIVQGDMVVVHHHILQNPQDRGMVFVDLFRVEDGMIEEHWDVEQAVPAKSANKATMY